MLMGIYVQLTRCYELLAIIAQHLDPEATDKVVEMQEQGVIISAPPAQVAYMTAEGKVVPLESTE